MSMPLMEKAALCYNAAISKKAKDIVMLDVGEVSDIADVFLIASGSSTTQVKTIVDTIEAALRAAGEKKYHIEGYQNAWWVLIDAGDIVCHIFIDEARQYYELERHWSDAANIEPDSATVMEV